MTTNPSHDDPHHHPAQHAPSHAPEASGIHAGHHAPHALHPPHVKPHALHKSWWERRWMLVVIPVTAAMAGIIVWSRLSEESSDQGSPASAPLVAQMKSASEGWVEGMNSFGGKIFTQEDNGKRVITVTNIPNKPCVETSWALAREGQITVNGVFLPRLSAGKLAELCSQGDNKSTIMWMPK